VYASLEGPEAAAYVRGTAKLSGGEAYLELPEHFAKIVAAVGLTVQLTPRDAGSYGLAAVELTPTHLHVKELMRGTGNYEFDYAVTGVRLGYENYEAVRPAKSDRTARAGRQPAAAAADRDDRRRTAPERLRPPVPPPAPDGPETGRTGAAALRTRLGADGRQAE
jgi:hypothetical protein